MLILFRISITLILTNLFSITSAIPYDDRHNYDAYGTSMVSTDHFVVIAQNDGLRYTVVMAPYGSGYVCNYNYTAPNYFVINIAVSRRQNASQLFFVYLLTNSIDGYYQTLGLFTFSQERRRNSTGTSCSRMLGPNFGERIVKVWGRPAPEMSTLKIDPNGNYAYGFLSNYIFIYDILNSSVEDLSWNDVFPSIILDPHALDIGQTNDGISMAIVAGYFQFDIGKTLPGVYLVRLNPPYSMTLVDNYTIQSDNQKFVRGRYSSSYQFDYVMSISIHDATQQALVAIPQSGKTYLFSFTSTNLTFVQPLNHPARSTAWLDDDGIQAGLLLSSTNTLPWAQSRVEVVNVSSDKTIYAYPNNQQTLAQWVNIPPTFIRLTTTFDHQLVILTSDGTMVLVPVAEPGYYIQTDDIIADRPYPIPCPSGTYKSIRGATPCTICPTGTKTSSYNNISSNSSNGMNENYPTIICTACSRDSFCPLASLSDMNLSWIESTSQAYAYPPSPSITSFDDILMRNTFSLSSTPRRCLLISPFFWALITLVVAFIILVVMGLLYHSPTGVKHFHRLEFIFRHSDLIGNGELWFGGLISFAVVILIIYGFWFGSAFVLKYPIETSTDADFACDSSLRNTQFSSLLQLLATIKSDQEKPMFDMLDKQKFTVTINFLQTGFSCRDITSQENVDTYSVSYPIENCTEETDNATLTVTYQISNHQMTLQINLTGLYYIGGLFICLTGPRSISNDSLYIVQQMNHCESFYNFNDTLGQTTKFYFALTKVVNSTDSLDYSGSSNYSGIWIPTTTHGSLNDRLVYDQRGPFLRYLSTQHTVIISFSETQFYVSNSQQPIARTGEIIFHNILFTTTILAIFGLAFLMFKLTFMTIIKSLIKHPMVLLQLCKLKKEKQDITVEQSI